MAWPWHCGAELSKVARRAVEWSRAEQQSQFCPCENQENGLRFYFISRFFFRRLSYFDSRGFAFCHDFTKIEAETRLSASSWRLLLLLFFPPALPPPSSFFPSSSFFFPSLFLLLSSSYTSFLSFSFFLSCGFLLRVTKNLQLFSSCCTRFARKYRITQKRVIYSPSMLHPNF